MNAPHYGRAKQEAAQALSSSKLFAKMFLDRRAHKGHGDFSFRWRSAAEGFKAIGVRSRNQPFQRTLQLRKGSSDLRTFEQVFLNSDYNLRRLVRWEDILHQYEQLCQVGAPLILDLGANVGFASVYFKLSWPKASIVAVEPDSENFEMLRRNTEGLSGVQIRHAAIASTVGRVRIANPMSAAWARQTEVSNDADDTNPCVAAITIPDLLSDSEVNGLPSVPFICKIDIEGFEKNLFAENLKWIEQFPVIIIELHDWLLPRQATSNSFLRAISAQDRDFVFIGENVFSVRNGHFTPARD